MSVVIVIPARHASTRYPGKPLVELRGASGQGLSLIRRSWEAARAAQGIDRVIVATDDDRIREHAESAYHPCGTARMVRREDRMAVVDPECRVIGVEGLRVADSSIFPRITNGNLNAPSIMTGEKAADHILGEGMMAPLNQGPAMDPDWREKQRSA